MERYLVSGLAGGIGNQLFQYASGYGIASELGVELRFDGSWLRPDERWLPELLGPHYHAASRLDLARVGEVGSGQEPIDKIVRGIARRSVRGARRLAGRGPAVHEHRGPLTGRFDPSVYDVQPPAILRGWYQSERYFERVADVVHSRLRLPDAVLPATLADGGPLVAVSFRRGDYVRLGWEIPLAYYERALARVVHEIPDARFLVFGDDALFVQLATEWVGHYGDATDAYQVADGALDHLVLASACDHSVIANSSFAWWGAWLGERRAGSAPRLVLAPTAYGDRFGHDIVPDRWHLVSSD